MKRFHYKLTIRIKAKFASILNYSHFLDHMFRIAQCNVEDGSETVRKKTRVQHWPGTGVGFVGIEKKKYFECMINA